MQRVRGGETLHTFFAMLPPLQTPRLQLRALRLDDAADQWAYARDPAVAHPGMWAPLPTLEENIEDLAATLARYAAGQPAEWGVQHRAAGRLIGRCGFVRYRAEHRNAEIGYALARPYWGQGLMSEALGAVLACGFDVLALHRVEATCLADNAGSIRVLEKAGFRWEGTAREAYLHRGTYRDLRRYALLQQDWQGCQPGAR
jgi:[ribosomal protein S5]-alanine N-acetyltransferase